MTKEEMLRTVVPNNCYWEDNFDNVPRHYIETAMDQYAKQECMELLEYMREELFIHHNPEEIYNLFLQSTAR